MYIWEKNVTNVQVRNRNLPESDKSSATGVPTSKYNRIKLNLNFISKSFYKGKPSSIIISPEPVQLYRVVSNTFQKNTEFSRAVKCTLTKKLFSQLQLLQLVRRVFQVFMNDVSNSWHIQKSFKYVKIKDQESIVMWRDLCFFWFIYIVTLLFDFI